MNTALLKFRDDPVSNVILLLTLVTIPHFNHIPTSSTLTIISLLIWRSLMTINSKLQPAKVIIILITVLLSLIIYQHSGGYSGMTAGSHLLVVMSFLKLLESKTSRDYMLLVILSLFIIATNFLFSQSFYTALYMFFCVFITLITLLSISEKSTKTSLTDKLKTSFKLIAFSLPLMVVAFIFFPRISGQLWHTNDSTSQAKTGLSESMEPGQISQLIYSNDLVFRARFDAGPPAKNQLYWRAITLWNYDGKKWEKNSLTEDETRIHILTPPQQYTITLEPSNNKWLFLLDLPVTISNSLNINTDFTAKLTKPVNSLFQYSARSGSDYYMSTKLNKSLKKGALALPGLNIKTKQLALQWKQNSPTTEDIINKALTYFSQQNFYYTLSPPALKDAASTDEFLFKTRQGFCEHYASAFAVLMRAAGIPSRIVLGYLGGDLNPYNNVISVNQSMAHAWNEVWIENRGWVRIDPTASIAPERVNKDIIAALKDQANLPLHIKLDFSALNKIRQIVDLIDNQWNQWVLNYNAVTQKKLLEILTNKQLTLADISYLFIKFIFATLFITVIFFFLNLKTQKTDTVTKAYHRFLIKAEKAGLKKRKNEGPEDFKSRLLNRFPALENEISLIMNLYIELKFQKTKNAGTTDRFVRAVRHFNIKQK